MFQRTLIDPIWTPERRGFGGRMLLHQCVAVPAMMFIIALANSTPSEPLTIRRDHRAPTVTRISSTANAAAASNATATSVAVAVAPSGWRKTKDGWQHVSQWTDVPTITMRQSLQMRQNRQSSRWQRSFDRISRVAPWHIAMFQIGTIAAIFTISQRLRRTRGKKDDYRRAERIFSFGTNSSTNCAR